MQPMISPQGYPSWDKDPSAVKDYSLDWAQWLETDTIITSVWEVPAGITKNSDGHSTTVASIWLSSGSIGRTYIVRNTITTTMGRTETRSIEIKVSKQ